MRTAVICGESFGLAGLRRLITIGADIRAIFTHRREVYYDKIGKGMDSSFYVGFSGLAQEAGIPLYFVRNINGRKNVERLRRIRPDLIIVMGWSQIIKPDILNLPHRGIVGFHPSLLPKRRGGAPLNWAIIDGLTQTGQTFFYYTDGVDSGDIIAQKKVGIALEDTCQTLYGKLIDAALELLTEYWPLLQDDRAPRIPQNHEEATYTSRRRPEDGLIDWSMPALQICNLIRGVTKPYPGAFTYWKGQELTIWSCRLHDAAERAGRKFGEVIDTEAPGILVSTGQGVLELGEVGICQKSMRAVDFVRKYDVSVGQQLGDLQAEERQ